MPFFSCGKNAKEKNGRALKVSESYRKTGSAK
jgi:hypothetical protein